MNITKAEKGKDGCVRLLLTWSREFVHRASGLLPILQHTAGAGGGEHTIDLTLTEGEANDLENVLALLRTEPAGLTEEPTPPPPSMKAGDGFGG